jgi:peptide/nickel transport system permease protein
MCAGTPLGQTVILEQVLNINALGSLLLTSVNTSDSPTAQGITIVFAVPVSAAISVTYLLFLVVDPRVQLGGQHGASRERPTRSQKRLPGGQKMS